MTQHDESAQQEEHSISNHQVTLWAPTWLSSKARVTLGMSYICTKFQAEWAGLCLKQFVQIYDIPNVTLAFDDNQLGAHNLSWWLLSLIIAILNSSLNQAEH